MSLDFTAKPPSSVEIFSLDCTDDLAVGEIIVDVVWACVVVTGVDAGASFMVTGQPTGINGAIVSVLVQNGVPGAYYRLVATITTSLGQTFQKYGHFIVGSNL